MQAMSPLESWLAIAFVAVLITAWGWGILMLLDTIVQAISRYAVRKSRDAHEAIRESEHDGA